MKTITRNLLIAVTALACLGPVERAVGQFSYVGGHAALPDLRYSSLAWGDYNNDGKLDLAVAGDTGAGYIARIYRNFGHDTFKDIHAGLPGVFDCSLAWGDYDNDGRLDLALAGDTGAGYVSKIYHNNSDGTFTDIGAGLVGVALGSLAWGDYNNDGDLDLALAGRTGPACVSKIYHNNGDGTFTDIDAGLTGVSACSLAWGDYDNDGNLDLALAGYTNNVMLSKIYRNNGNGSFGDIDAGLTGISHGSLAWGDYDNDGDLDLALAGFASPTDVSAIYRNIGNGTFTDINAGLLGVLGGSLAWGDYDNDGMLDLALAGFAGTTNITKIYHNNGDGTFAYIAADLTGVDFGSLAWGDFDNDGKLDLAVAGERATSGSVSRIYHNDAGVPNAPPTAPTGLTSSLSALGVIFSWNAARDAQTPAAGLSYNLRVGTVPGGSNVFCGMADPASGERRLPATGNTQKRLSWTLKGLGVGPYYWSVQAIDTAFAGSPWAAEVIAPPDSDGDGDPDVTDCAPSNPAIHHGAAEICNDGIDNNCDSLIDAADPQCRHGVNPEPAAQALTFYRDADGDGYGDPSNSVQALLPPAGYVIDNTDCDDANAAAHPGAAEICNDSIDNNCNGQTDGADPACGCGMCGMGVGMMMPFTILGWIALRGLGRRRPADDVQVT